MVRNITGGNKQKGKKRSAGIQKRIIEYADEINSLYALVTSPLGDCKFLVHCNDNIDRIGIIRGSLYKHNFISAGDLVLITLRDFEKVKFGVKERCDIVIKYQPEEIEQLKRKKVFYLNSTNAFNLTLVDAETKKNNKEKETDHIAFDANIQPQKTLEPLEDTYISEDDNNTEDDDEENENESSDNEYETDEYGNIKH